MRSVRAALCAGLLCTGAALPVSAGEQRTWYADVKIDANETEFSGVVTDVSLCGLLGLGTATCPFVGEEVSRTSSTGYGVSATLGRKLGFFRIEGEVAYSASDATQYAELSQLTAMLNGLFDVPVTDSITLSLGGGVGFDAVSWDHTSLDAEDSSFAYQAIAGVSVALTDTIDLTLDYRFKRVPDVALDVTMQYNPTNVVALTVDKLDTQAVSVGIRFAL